jgi:hypothetical protein
MNTKPKIKPLAIDDFNQLGLDEEGQLYWKNRPIKTEQKLSVSSLLNIAAIATALATVTQGICAIIQTIK